MIPSHGWTPSSSPPTAQPTSIIRPRIELVADDVVQRDPALSPATTTSDGSDE
jgi:hypothetical protein